MRIFVFVIVLCLVFLFISLPACKGSREEELVRREQAVERHIGEINNTLQELEKEKDQMQIEKRELEQTQEEVRVLTEGLKKDSFSDGVWQVGVDIQSGRYKAPNAGARCYWAKLQEDEGILANNIGGPAMVTITPLTFKFESRHCGTWSKTN